MRYRTRAGFTLIELLVVIVIILLLLSLILPAIVEALCLAREATAEAMIVNLTTAAQSYWIDKGVYPPGDGSGSQELAYHLSKEGPRDVPYFEFHPHLLWRSHILNPVWEDAGAPRNILYYRNNVDPASQGKPSGAGVPQPPVFNKKSFDLWGAGCRYEENDPSTSWSMGNW